MVADLKLAPFVFNMKTPYLEQGRTTEQRARTDNLVVTVKVYAEGGENGMHHHTNDDHAFIVVEGEATFHLEEEENVYVVKKYEGVMLPKGANYRFESTGEENLVLFRVAAIHQPGARGGRIKPDGDAAPSDSEYNGRVERIERPGKGFGD
jgi:mannose-6-phosphate isomerase-like protein (cupin superfamily)